MNKLVDFPYRRVLVLGLAKSGTATCHVLRRNGIDVIANDLKASELDANVLELKANGVHCVLGDHPTSLLDKVELVIKNPGIPYHNVMVKAAQAKGLPIWTEIECLNYFPNNQIAAVTGSNGKTTTTTLLHLMLQHSQQPAEVAGNIGRVALEVAEKMDRSQKLVLELSSFQLMGIEKFKPRVAVLLNLFEAHIDYHGSFNDYQLAKARIFANQSTEDFLIYNRDDARVSELIKSASATLIPFSTKQPCPSGAWADHDAIYFRNEKVMALRDIRLVGEHNRENILASVSAALLLGASIDGIQQTLSTFTGVKHRLQYVTEKNGRLFYNDSKATNILASSKALSSFSQPTLLLAGGLDRGNDFEALIPFLKNVKGMFVYGQTADKLAEAGRRANVPLIQSGQTLEEMLKKAYANSDVGDVILLSPACASWDQFKTFEDRGDMFIETVHTL
ncbi:UDP-N-acetylmuramoyl-L-alanine--D-glutamate ligase [Amphibacillus sediminis]|uniref:UDP-N-acetylmuramoyl-L-alanine--D-glutamate ligase n=1 Tax=Amphibacillus sediminis TaxID=360185 RepID=UPI00082BBA38|nr:UDP-N-acetylmuramoyl-L-alanine--D-glutamate ligase [Amphibacillus sediminis]